MLEAICGWKLDTPRGTVLFTHDTAVMYDRWTRALSPLLYYPFNASASDASGYGRHGTLAGSPSFVAPTAWLPESGWALNLNGTTQHVVTGWTPSDLVAPFTLEAWVDLTATTAHQVIIDAHSEAAKKGAALWANRYGDFDLSIWDGTNEYRLAVVAALASNNNPHHLAGTFDGSTLALYIDGVLARSDSVGGAVMVPCTTLPATIGVATDLASHRMGGLVDEVAAYPVAMSAQMVADRYAIGSAIRASRAILTETPNRSVNGRRAIDPYPREDGAAVGDLYDNEAIWMLAGKLKALTATVLNTDAQTIRGRINSMRRADGTLKWAPLGFPPLQSTVRRYERPDVDKGRGLVKDMNVSFVAGDPRVYSAEQKTVTASATSTLGFPNPFPNPIVQSGSGGEQTVTNLGDTDAPVTLRVYGPATNPIIYNLTTGAQIRLMGLVVLSGQYVTVDTARKTVKVNDVQDVYAYYDSPNSTMWKLQPGSNSVRLVATSTDTPTRLDVVYRHAWLP